MLACDQVQARCTMERLISLALVTLLFVMASAMAQPREGKKDLPAEKLLTAPPKGFDTPRDEAKGLFEGNGQRKEHAKGKP